MEQSEQDNNPAPPNPDSMQTTELLQSFEVDQLLTLLRELKGDLQSLHDEVRELRREINKLSSNKRPSSLQKIKASLESKDKLQLVQMLLLVIPFIGLLIAFIFIMLVRN